MTPPQDQDFVREDIQTNHVRFSRRRALCISFKAPKAGVGTCAYPVWTFAAFSMSMMVRGLPVAPSSIVTLPV